MRTFQYFPLIYKPQTAPSSFFILNAARMNQPSFSQIVQLVERNERNLSEFRQILLEFKQGLDALIGKVDFLADQFIARNQPGMCSPVARLRPHNGLLTPTPNVSCRGLELRGSRQ